MPDHQHQRRGFDEITRRTFPTMPHSVVGSAVFASPMPMQRARPADAPGRDCQLKAPKPNLQRAGALCANARSAPVPSYVNRQEPSPSWLSMPSCLTDSFVESPISSLGYLCRGVLR